MDNIYNSKEEFARQDNKSFISLNSEVRIIENLDDESLCASFAKALQDFTIRDMTKLIFKFWIYVKNL